MESIWNGWIPWNPYGIMYKIYKNEDFDYGIHMEWYGMFMESIWNSPHGFHGQFPWIPYGMGLHSKKLPSPLWIPWTGFHGFHLESTWNPHGINT
jgi:hypothetical protein